MPADVEVVEPDEVGPPSIDDRLRRLDAQARATRAEGEFIERLVRVRQVEDAGGPDGFDAERLLDRLRDALSTPLSAAAFDVAVQDVAADLFGDQRWEPRP